MILQVQRLKFPIIIIREKIYLIFHSSNVDFLFSFFTKTKILEGQCSDRRIHGRPEFFDQPDISNCTGSGTDTWIENREGMGKFISQKVGHEGWSRAGMGWAKQKSEDEENGGNMVETGRERGKNWQRENRETRN